MPGNCSLQMVFAKSFSFYLFCLSGMAAEMSTGALALTHLYKRKPAVSMLVVKVEAEYFKKALAEPVLFVKMVN